MSETDIAAQVPEAGLSTLEGVPREWVDDVVDALRRSGVDPKVQIRDEQVFAGVEWLVPTAALLFLGAEYVRTLVSEAAKEQYPHIKRALSHFALRMSKLEVTRMASGSRKLSDDPPGNLTVGVGTDSGVSIRFIFPADPNQYESALRSLFEILEDDLRRASLGETFVERSQDGRFAWRIVARYSVAAGSWVLCDAIAGTEWPF